MDLPGCFRPRQIPFLLAWICVVVCVVSGRFINFQRGYEYQYTFQSDASIKDVGQFNVQSKVSFTNIQDTPGGQELLLRVYGFRFTRAHDQGVPGHDLDLSKWFSFVISPHGEIFRVYHPQEDDEVIAVKKGFAALLAGKLHDKHEVTGHYGDDGWSYNVEEFGHEGHHNATYTILPLSAGTSFKKIRHSHPVPNAKGKYVKTMDFHDDLGTIHSVMIEEDFTSPTHPKDFDPHYGMRRVKAVNKFSTMVYPEMSAISKGHLKFLTRYTAEDIWTRPTAGINVGSIHIDKYNPKKQKVNVDVAWRGIRGNLTCMWNQPDQGSPMLNICFFKIVDILRSLPDAELTKIAEHYFNIISRTLNKNKANIQTILDVFGVLWTDHAQDLLTKHIFLNSDPDHALIQRLLVHVVGVDTVPTETILTTMEDIAFNPWKFPKSFYNRDTYHRTLLALGSVSNKLIKAGFKDRALWLMDKVHDMVGLHDPWEYRTKRAAMSEAEQIDYDRRRVVLLETLGNARLDESFVYIMSHINTTNSPWIKRAGCHALRKYNHQEAANVLLNAAIGDDDENVRYEAILLYQAHPKSSVIAPVDNRVRTANGTSMIVDPYSAGIYDVQPHNRRRRGGNEPFLEFNLQAPSVDFRKLLGSESLGASFGVIMVNMLDINIAPLSGHIKLNVHDEAYARVHLGLLGENLDFFVARICFKGETSYNINILQEGEMKKIAKLAKNFDKSIKNIVNAVETGVNLFKDIIDGKFSIKDIVQSFVDALQELPGKVWDLRYRAVRAMHMFGQLDENELPKFLRPLRNLIYKVTTLYSDIKTDVLNFYNTLVQTITIIIPQQAKLIYEAILDIIDGFSVITKDPKTAIMGIGKGVVTVFMAVKELLDAKNKTQEACFFLKDQRPDWWDLGQQFDIIMAMTANASNAIQDEGTAWVNQPFAEGEDLVAAFTGGKMNTSVARQQLLENLTAIRDELLEPFADLRTLAKNFLLEYGKVFTLVKSIKQAYTTLKEGYDFARSIIDRLFGPKAHKDFPRTTRLDGGGCGKDGFYPSKLDKSGQAEYEFAGVDLTVEEDINVVAPFPGLIYITDNANEVRINATGGSLRDIVIVITNVKPNSTILKVTDFSYIEKRVAGGQVVGKSVRSPCTGNNHIHFAMFKPGGLLSNDIAPIDPKRFLEPRFPGVPKWIQHCDDYRLVYKFETIAEGTIVGLGGQGQNNTSPKMNNTNVKPLPQLPKASDPGLPVQSVKENPAGMYTKKESQPTLADDLDQGIEDQCPSPTTYNPGTSPTTTTTTTTVAPATKKKPGLFSNLLKKADSFLKKFSLRRLRMGTIIEFLDRLGMDESKEKMANVIKTIKRIIDNKPCLSPQQMSDEQLRMELQSKGINSTGSREVLRARLLKNENKCPLLSFTMPKNVYCTFQENCMGVECCINAKIYMFLKVFKVWARFNPCEFEFSFGLEDWNHTLTMERVSFDGLEDEIYTGLKLDILGGVELVIKYKIQKTDYETVADFGMGLCSMSDPTQCPLYFPLLDKAVLPLPTCYPNGTVVWPQVNFKDFFSKDAIAKRLKEAGAAAVKMAAEAAASALLEVLGLPSDMLDETDPCPRGEIKTDKQLRNELTSRGLSTVGNRPELLARYSLDDRTCSVFNRSLTVPEIGKESLKKIMYYFISDNCMRLDACADISIQLGDLTYTKAFKAHVELDPCNFILKAKFEKISISVVLISYEWGKTEYVQILQDVMVKFSIGKDDVRKVFVVNFGISICPADGSSCFIDDYFLSDLDVPIPICNENFTLPGGGSIGNFVAEIGGKMTAEAFQLILRMFDLDKVFTEGPCVLETGPKDCPVSLDPTRYLPDSVKSMFRCEMTDDCFGIKCCLDLSFTVPLGDVEVQLNVPFHFQVQPCDLMMDAKLGTYRHQTQLLTYEWGTPGSVDIGSGDQPPIQITYNLARNEDKTSLLIDLGLTMCFPLDGESFCIPDGSPLELLKAAELPCDARALANLTRTFSFKNFTNQLLNEVGKVTSRAALDVILKALGLEDFFKEPACDPTRGKYTPSSDSGWNNLCPLGIVKMPNLPDKAKCHIPYRCSAVYCCAKETKVTDLSFEFFLDIDMCNYTLKGGVESVTFEVELLNYEFGKLETINIGDVVFILYRLKKPPNRKIFIIDLSLKFCPDADECFIEIPVLESTEIPQILCDINATLSLRDFNVKDWMANLHQNLTQRMTGAALDLLLQQLGLDDFLRDSPCNRSSPTYWPSTNGWKDDCGKSFLSLPDISSYPLTCAVPDFCSGIDCCLEYSNSFFSLTLNIYLIVDTCNYEIRGGIENFGFVIPIINYKWGKVETILLKTIQITFSIVRLPAAKKFLVDLDVSVCFDPTSDGSCDFTQTIFQQTKLQQILCDLNTPLLPDFSLKNWIQDKGLELGKSLTTALANKLLEELGIMPFLYSTPCDRQVGRYIGDENGWNSACPVNMTLPRIRGPVTCHIPDYCTGVDCCVEVGPIGRSFNTYVLMDACKFELRIGIENFNFNVSLFAYDYGKHEQIYLKGVIRIDFILINLEGEKKYMLNLNLSICFEQDSDDCLISLPIFEDFKMTKLFCDWNGGFQIPDFSLDGYIGSLDLPSGTTLTGILLDQLLEKIGLSAYLLETPCSHSNAPFAAVSASNNWNDECGHIPILPALPSRVHCHLTSNCMGVSCCLEVEEISKSIHLYIELDACDYILRLGIEKIQREILLFDYTFGTEDFFSLAGIFRVTYEIFDLKEEKEFLLSLSIDACFESNSDCTISVPVFDQQRIPKPLCNFDATFAIANFSFEDYIREQGERVGEVISGQVADQVLEALGIATYMSDSPCARTQAPYYSSEDDHWNNACPKSLNLPSISGPVSCHVPDYCTGIECCVDVPFIPKTFRVFILLDACNNKFEIGIEKFKQTVFLISYNWGEWKTFYLKGVVKIDYMIRTLPDDKMYVLNLNTSVCLSDGVCDFDQVILSDTYVPIPGCDWTTGFPDFSLSQWLHDQEQSAGAVLSEIFISKLMETLGWTPYLNNPSCSMSSYLPANADNWKVADCPLAIGNNTLPSLPADLSCRLPSHCTGVDCCLSLGFISRTLNAYVDVDSCHFTLSFGIEKLQHEITLFTYDWGKQEHLYLNGGFRLDFTIDNNEADQTFVFSLNMSLCLEGISGSCMEEMTVFKDAVLPKPGCNWAMGFRIPDFALSNWLTDNGMIVGQSLSRYYAAKLMEYLGVAKYMLTTPCQRSSSYYSPSQNQWKKDCPLDISLPNILSVPMTCYIPDYCTGIDCCLDVDFLGMSFRSFVLLDGCGLNLQIGIEQLAINESLSGYLFGTPRQLYVEGVLRIDYLIEDLTVERQYKVDVNLSICLNADPSVACLYSVEVYRNTLLPKPLCDLSGGFSIPNFSLVDWLTTKSIAIGSTLAAAAATELMDNLGISSYLNTDQCSLSSDTYAHAVNGWTSECPFETSLPAIGSPDVRCHLPSYCSGVQCCIQVDFISRSFQAYALINTCTHQLEVGIEKFIFKQSLFNYLWGTKESIWLLGVVRVDFILTEKSLTSYELNMNISVCFVL
ncbi:uncharacterized protein LOC110450253 [Mizuhopecten yessoensis]|uniref:uncharacterized protein LOC110450253 n=1 Tax=Mizuhopecten yessoensis TaxID=6573 RepID=UPI000B45E4A0|nr:uncharacterized protein LOC110450253 [Mizuhopecten yessoensis]